MRIYQLATQLDQAYLYLPDADGDILEPDPPRRLAAEWPPLTFELVREDEIDTSLPTTDFPHYLASTCFLSARAVERLRPILLACGEILPIDVSNDPGKFYFFNVTRTISAVDMHRSRFIHFPDGGIMEYEQLVFDPLVIPDEPIFFKTTQLGPITEIFATEKAVQAVNQSGLTGYEFRIAGSND